ncbi:MAG: Gfo/Idh/MocA family oxidoreductase [Verrucomicrobiia bacterium]
MNTHPQIQKEHRTADAPNPIARRDFLGTLGLGSVAAAMAGGWSGLVRAADLQEHRRQWQPSTERKVRVGIVGYGVCRFGADFGFQNHPNVEIVAVSDLFPERRDGLMKACRCSKSYASLEELVKDPTIEAVFVATDAPSHARHCREVLLHGKHVMCAVPATWGDIEDGERLLEAVKKTGLKYMMAETSCYHVACHAMRTVYRAGGFGRLVYSEGEYFHHSPSPIDSYKGWRIGSPPLWYPTHSTAYYVGVTGQRFTAVSCLGFPGTSKTHQGGANAYKNPFADEFALFETSEGGISRMCMSMSVHGHVNETGRVFGELGRMEGLRYLGAAEKLPDISRPSLPPAVPEGGHGGSHGPLMHEFISSILEDREPLVNIYDALNMTVSGIVAHQSALKGGERLKIPSTTRPAA